MTVDDVKATVKKIEAERDDDEAAHGDEDDLHQAVLAWIAAGGGNARELAQAALETQGIRFARWCA